LSRTLGSADHLRYILVGVDTQNINPWMLLFKDAKHFVNESLSDRFNSSKIKDNDLKFIDASQ
jgi:hypothetical protein